MNDVRIGKMCTAYKYLPLRFAESYDFVFIFVLNYSPLFVIFFFFFILIKRLAVFIFKYK